MKNYRLFWFVLTLLLLTRMTYYFVQPDLSTDHLSQMAMAEHFMEGYGFSFEYLNSQAEVYYSTHIQWPPLYPFLISIITFLTTNLLLSSFILQIFVLVSLIIIWNNIFNLLKEYVSTEAFFYFISLLIISTSILNNINSILVFSLLLLSISIYFSFGLILNEKFRIRNIVLASLFSSLLFWTHYSYFLVAFYPAVILFTIFLLQKEKYYLFAAMGSGLISLVITTGVILYNFLSTGFINYMDNPHIWNAGFFPEHLLLTDPFFLNSFFKTSFFLDYIFNHSESFMLNLVFNFISLIILILIISLFLQLKKKSGITYSKIIQIFLPFVIISVLTLTFLLYFTLHYHEIPRPNWTHIGDPRYLSAVYISILATLIILVFARINYLKEKLINTFKLVLILLIFLNFSVNVLIIINHWNKYSLNSDEYKVPYSDLQNLFDNIKLEISDGNKPVFIDNDLTVRSVRISQYAGATVINSDEVTKIKIIPDKMVFFYFLPKQESDVSNVQLKKWAGQFNINDAGKVYTDLNLFKVTKE